MALLVATPTLLLPSHTTDALELVALLALLAGVLTFTEYNSEFPSLVEFRDAPPLNRMRFIALSAMFLMLTIIVLLCPLWPPLIMAWPLLVLAVCVPTYQALCRGRRVQISESRYALPVRGVMRAAMAARSGCPPEAASNGTQAQRMPSACRAIG